MYPYDAVFNMFSLIFEISCELEVRSGCVTVRIRFSFDRVVQRWSWAAAGASPGWHDVSGLEWLAVWLLVAQAPASLGATCVQQQ